MEQHGLRNTEIIPSSPWRQDGLLPTFSATLMMIRQARRSGVYDIFEGVMHVHSSVYDFEITMQKIKAEQVLSTSDISIIIISRNIERKSSLKNDSKTPFVFGLYIVLRRF